MEVFKCVSTLSSIRSYIKKEVPDEIIMEVLEAGRLAPSAHNDQPWQFILVRDKSRLSDMKKYCLSGGFISQVDFAVVVVTDPSSKWHEIDSTRAVQNMALTAWSNKLGTCWIGRLEKKGLMDFLNIPENLNILTVLPFGYFNDNLAGGGKYRKDPDQVFYLDTYGNNMK
ncbi:MAG: nitroreductase family protein [Deltaproteobacteria bacterium]|nr:nitroreductase family protein [Deltaproteobacteria bacterium]MCK5710859.1 nitroreductase family protein [Deltaproteobacteria bacterium]